MLAATLSPSDLLSISPRESRGTAAASGNSASSQRQPCSEASPPRVPPPPPLLTQGSLPPELVQPLPEAIGDIRLASHFQPIYSVPHRRPVGYEGLIRGTSATGAPVRPAELFGAVKSPAGLLALDRACRATHMANYSSDGPTDCWLFLNLNPQVVRGALHHGDRYTRALMEHYRIPPHRVVVEILEHTIDDAALLAEVVAYYRAQGCLVALDDFGAGHSNFDRIWQLGADLVKLDRSMTVNATRIPAARRVLPGLVRLLHEAQCLVLMEGVETMEEADLALECDVDLVQGFAFARPGPLGNPQEAAGTIRLRESAIRHQRHSQERLHRRWQTCSIYRGAFWNAAIKLEARQSLAGATAPLFALANVLRCYLLDAQGIQQGGNLLPPGSREVIPSQLLPMASSEQADWSRRAYFQQAIHNPGQLQVSGPYLSLPDKSMCLTLSRTVRLEGETLVFCCDVAWRGDELPGGGFPPAPESCGQS